MFVHEVCPRTSNIENKSCCRQTRVHRLEHQSLGVSPPTPKEARESGVSPATPKDVTPQLPLKSDVKADKNKTNGMSPCWTFARENQTLPCLLYLKVEKVKLSQTTTMQKLSCIQELFQKMTRASMTEMLSIFLGKVFHFPGRILGFFSSVWFTQKGKWALRLCCVLGK